MSISVLNCCNNYTKYITDVLPNSINADTIPQISECINNLMELIINSGETLDSMKSITVSMSNILDLYLVKHYLSELPTVNYLLRPIKEGYLFSIDAVI